MITRHLRPKGEGTFGQAVRYVLASCVALVLDAGILVGLVQLGAHPYVAFGCGLVAGALFGYWVCHLWVFAGRKIARHHRAFLLFLAIGVVGLGVAYLVFWLARDVVDLPGLVGLEDTGDAPSWRVHLANLLCKAPSAVASFAWNFSVRKLLLFR